MAFPLKRVLDPATEPIDLATMKNYLRVDIDDDDALISTLISVARERAEDMTARCLLPQQWTFSFDHFPHRHYEAGRFYSNHHHGNSMFRSDHNSIILPRGPVQSVDNITYKDQSGTVQTLAPSAYTADLLSEPARVNPAYGTSWPTARYDQNSVTVSFTAGYSSIPQSFLHAIKLITAAYYENRAEVVQGSGNFNKFPTPLSAESLLSTYQLFPVGYPKG